MTKLSLFIPGLFGPDAAFVSDYVPELPALSTLLCRGRGVASGVESESVYRTLYRLLGFPLPTDADIPVGAVSRRLDVQEDSTAVWVRADPVHIQADRDGAIMFDADRFQLDRRDALALAGELRESFSLLGWELEVPMPGRWYLRLPATAAVQTVEPDRVSDNDMLQYLPTGPVAGDWHRLINEVQMLLHNSEVNRLREQRGELPVNSLWLWGGGVQPQPVTSQWDTIYSSDVFVTSLADLSATACHALPDSVEGMTAEQFDGTVLVYLDALQDKVQYRDLQGWHDTLLQYEQNWFAPLLKCLRKKQISELSLHCGPVIYTVNRMQLRFFWRRRRPFARYVEQAMA
ncbi:MAG: hypothetical protein ACR2P9_07735 [Gammaproteobacteria bacterium]